MFAAPYEFIWIRHGSDKRDVSNYRKEWKLPNLGAQAAIKLK